MSSNDACRAGDRSLGSRRIAETWCRSMYNNALLNLGGSCIDLEGQGQLSATIECLLLADFSR